jgi:hypothetical protein
MLNFVLQKEDTINNLKNYLKEYGIHEGRLEVVDGEIVRVGVVPKTLYNLNSLYNLVESLPKKLVTKLLSNDFKLTKSELDKFNKFINTSELSLSSSNYHLDNYLDWHISSFKNAGNGVIEFVLRLNELLNNQISMSLYNLCHTFYLKDNRLTIDCIMWGYFNVLGKTYKEKEIMDLYYQFTGSRYIKKYSPLTIINTFNYNLTQILKLTNLTEKDLLILNDLTSLDKLPVILLCNKDSEFMKLKVLGLNYSNMDFKKLNISIDLFNRLIRKNISFSNPLVNYNGMSLRELCVVIKARTGIDLLEININKYFSDFLYWYVSRLI